MCDFNYVVVFFFFWCSDFHTTIQKKVKSKGMLNKVVTIKDKVIYDVVG